MSGVVTRFESRTPRSAAAAGRAGKCMPGGDTRAAAYHTPYPLTFARGARSRLWDIDGHEYIDLLGNYTSLVHGNAYPPVVEAVRKALPLGTAWAGRNVAHMELAETILERLPNAELVRFTNSGTEAAMLAMHIAKLATGRNRILMARMGYHGGHEDTEAGTFAGSREDALFGGRDGTGHATLVAEYGDADGFEEILRRRGDEIAAVFLEPVQGAGGVVAPPEGFLRRVLDATRAAGAVFVLDEVITFRLSEGGAQTSEGLAPDLTLLGKIIGGGFPIGAVAGRSDLLALTDPRRGRLLSSGTFSGNPVSACAGQVTLQHLGSTEIDAMHRRARRLGDGLLEVAADAGHHLGIRRVGSLLALDLTDDVQAELHLSALNHGVYYAPRGMLALSTALTDDDVGEVLERMAHALGAIEIPVPA